MQCTAQLAQEAQRTPTGFATMNTSNLNLNDLYFEYKVLTRIDGEPTFDSLMVLFQELKANTTAVPCTLGGGANGYLGMVVSAAQ